MSATVEFRKIKRMVNNELVPTGWYIGQEIVQFRTKRVIIGVLGVSLSDWSDWQDIPELLVNIETGEPI